jgi:hypothetical protein
MRQGRRLMLSQMNISRIEYPVSIRLLLWMDVKLWMRNILIEFSRSQFQERPTLRLVVLYQYLVT